MVDGRLLSVLLSTVKTCLEGKGGSATMLWKMNYRTVQVAVGALLLTFGVAFAQSGGPLVDTNSESGDKPVQESATDLLQEGQRWLGRMSADRDDVQKQLNDARQDQDVVKVLCLTDKLGQLDEVIDSASQRVSNLTRAAEQQDSEQASYEHGMLSALRDRVAALVSEASQCLGEELTIVAEPQVSTEVDENIPDDDSDIPQDNMISLPPVVSSATF